MASDEVGLIQQQFQTLGAPDRRGQPYDSRLDERVYLRTNVGSADLHSAGARSLCTPLEGSGLYTAVIAKSHLERLKLMCSSVSLQSEASLTTASAVEEEA